MMLLAYFPVYRHQVHVSYYPAKLASYYAVKLRNVRYVCFSYINLKFEMVIGWVDG